ncbi:MAG: copper chaperone PCu(A)C [Sphingomonadaceae bacterium]|jgi:periplasmic copper chaperone A
MRQTLLGTSLVIGLAMLAACDRAPEQPPQEQSAIEGPDGREGISVSDARLVLPLVEGRPGALYLTVANDGASAAELAAIYVEGAERVELHESRMEGGAMAMAAVDAIPVPAAGSVVLEQGGLHAMVFGLAPDFDAESTEITLIFADGDKTSVEARVTTVAEASN